MDLFKCTPSCIGSSSGFGLSSRFHLSGVSWVEIRRSFVSSGLFKNSEGREEAIWYLPRLISFNIFFRGLVSSLPIFFILSFVVFPFFSIFRLFNRGLFERRRLRLFLKLLGVLVYSWRIEWVILCCLILVSVPKINSEISSLIVEGVRPRPLERLHYCYSVVHLFLGVKLIEIESFVSVVADHPRSSVSARANLHFMVSCYRFEERLIGISFFLLLFKELFIHAFRGIIGDLRVKVGSSAVL